MPDVAAELRQRNRAVWGSGEWDEVSRLITEVGPKLLDRVGVEEGMEVLDVGTGTGGTVAIPAAQRGAKVTGSDLVSDHFEVGRRRAADAGVEIEWVEADAEALPFPDGSYDRVLSTFGHMFAPRHSRSAGEIARVCRSGGVIGTTTWVPSGFGGALFATLGKYMPPPPDFAQPPPLWGSEDHVREMLGRYNVELEFAHETVDFVHSGTADDFTRFYEEKFGPVFTAKNVLGDDWAACRADLVAAMDEHNVGGEGEVRLPSEYLVTIGRKTG
ncbi:MAG TPA: class I SAM-dependent methyltransferase [Thermoleophilaceae bacterium]|jgi:SAM-dependent methyltransferase